MAHAETGERVIERQELKAAHAEHRPGAGEAQHLPERAAAIHAALGAVAGGGIGGGGHRFVSLTMARRRRAMASRAGMPGARPNAAACRLTRDRMPSS